MKTGACQVKVINRGLEKGKIPSIFKAEGGEKCFVQMFRENRVKGECLCNQCLHVKGSVTYG